MKDERNVVSAIIEEREESKVDAVTVHQVGQKYSLIVKKYFY